MKEQFKEVRLEHSYGRKRYCHNGKMYVLTVLCCKFSSHFESSRPADHTNWDISYWSTLSVKFQSCISTWAVEKPHRNLWYRYPKSCWSGVPHIVGKLSTRTTSSFHVFANHFHETGCNEYVSWPAHLVVDNLKLKENSECVRFFWLLHTENPFWLSLRRCPLLSTVGKSKRTWRTRTSLAVMTMETGSHWKMRRKLGFHMTPAPTVMCHEVVKHNMEEIKAFELKSHQC